MNNSPSTQGYARHPKVGRDLAEELMKILTVPEE